LYSQALYDQFVSWYNLRNVIEITDDLGRVFSAYITDFAPTRVRSRSHPWKHTYTLTYTVLATA
jgi:hypothetical protein